MTTQLPNLQQLSADVCVAAQLTPAHMAAAAQSGFRSVVNNRPDMEGGPDQPTSAALAEAAAASGLRYEHLPVNPGAHSPEDIARFAALLAALPKPVLAFCRTGTRSGNLYRAASVL